MNAPINYSFGELRPLIAADAPALAAQANDYAVWINLRDAFPHPYQTSDAAAFIAYQQSLPRPDSLAVVAGGELAGVVGAIPGRDVQSVGAEVGYWLGRAYWGRGIASAMLDPFCRAIFPAWQLQRLFALPFADNTASCRVLEKCGFTAEGVLRRSARKAGRSLDQVMYARLSDS